MVWLSSYLFNSAELPLLIYLLQLTYHLFIRESLVLSNPGKHLKTDRRLGFTFWKGKHATLHLTRSYGKGYVGGILKYQFIF
jgi:hypothetical protein